MRLEEKVKEQNKNKMELAHRIVKGLEQKSVKT